MLAQTFPIHGINRQWLHVRRVRQAHKSALVRDASITKQPCEQRERMVRQSWIHEWLLSVQSFWRAAARLIIRQLGISDLREKLGHSPQARCASAISAVQRFAKYELAAVGFVAEVQPVMHSAVARRLFPDSASGDTGIHTPDDDLPFVET